MEKFKIINLDEWVKMGEGGTASSYFHKTDKTIMLKLFNESATKNNYATREYEFSQNVVKCGIATPKALEIVETNDGKSGIIYERIADKVSFSRLCADNPSDIEKYAMIFANELKKVHNTECNTKFFSSVKDIVSKCIEANKVLSKSNKKKLLDFIDELGNVTTCVHGDAHSGNLIDSKGNISWIDLGAFCYGSPWYDIGGVYFFYVDIIGIQFSKKLLHMNKKELKRFWKQFAYTYFDCKTDEEYKKCTEKAKKAAILFAIYTMDVERHKGITAIVDSIIVRRRVHRW